MPLDDVALDVWWQFARHGLPLPTNIGVNAGRVLFPVVRQSVDRARVRERPKPVVSYPE
ncbi:hypothetical protein ABH982_001925 [Bradyrhizobium ottawaense]